MLAKTYIFTTYFFTNEEEVLSHPFRLLNLLPTHPSHLLLYPLTDTPQEVFKHIHSVNSKLLHEIICFFQLRFQRPILSIQLLILLLQALILVFKVQHLFKVYESVSTKSATAHPRRI